MEIIDPLIEHGYQEGQSIMEEAGRTGRRRDMLSESKHATHDYDSNVVGLLEVKEEFHGGAQAAPEKAAPEGDGHVAADENGQRSDAPADACNSFSSSFYSSNVSVGCVSYPTSSDGGVRPVLNCESKSNRFCTNSSPPDISPWGSEKIGTHLEQHICSSRSQPTQEGWTLIVGDI